MGSTGSLGTAPPINDIRMFLPLCDASLHDDPLYVGFLLLVICIGMDFFFAASSTMHTLLDYLFPNSLCVLHFFVVSLLLQAAFYVFL